MQHKKKIKSEYFDQVCRGQMPFQIRNNDANYKSGDEVILYEVNALHYTGRYVIGTIGFVADYEQQLRYVVFRLLNLSEVKHGACGFDK